MAAANRVRRCCIHHSNEPPANGSRSQRALLPVGDAPLVMRLALRNFVARILAVTITAISVPSLHAQANLRLNIERTNGNPLVSWRMQSLVPSPGHRLFATYQILTSSNLVDWLPVGEPIPGTNFANREIRIDVHPTEPKVFV